MTKTTSDDIYYDPHEPELQLDLPGDDATLPYAFGLGVCSHRAAVADA